MPSGAKKRKAAKKKKGNQPNNNPNPSSASTHSHGGDKESDAGEVSSPASQDHHSHQNLLTEGEEEENVIPVEMEFRIEDESDKKDVSFVHDEAPRKSYDGGSSGSSSSSSSSNSSDDESHGNKSSQAAVDVAPIVDSVKLAASSSHGQAEAIKSTTIEEASGEKAVESVFQENGEKKPSAMEDDKVVISEGSKEGASSQQEDLIIQSVETIAPIPDPKECIAQETDEQLALSYNAPTATADNGTTAPEKDSGVTQPLLAPAPRPVERTSWKSCCGLFEMFTGSGR